MCSELLRIPVELNGVPLLGFGLLAAIWLLAWGLALARHAAKTGLDGDFWALLQPMAIGAGVLLLAPRFAPQGVPIRGYGVMLLLAISVGVAMAVYRARRHGIEPDTIFALVFWLFVAGIAGARAFFVIEYWEVRFADLPAREKLIGILQFTEGGLVVYGSVIGGLVAFLIFASRKRLPILGMADLLAPCFMAGLAIGRIGCLLNGCCYGGQTDAPWAVTFPPDSPPYMDQLVHGELHGLDIRVQGNEVVLLTDGQPQKVAAIDSTPIETLDDVAQALSLAVYESTPVTVRLTDGTRILAPASERARSLPVHPTQIYSTVNAALLAWLLWNWFPRRKRDGEVALLMFSLYPISRFLLEVIRTDEAAIFGTGLSISQNVSLVVLMLAALGWVWLLRSPPTRQLVRDSRVMAGNERTPSPNAA